MIHVMRITYLHTFSKRYALDQFALAMSLQYLPGWSITTVRTTPRTIALPHRAERTIGKWNEDAENTYPPISFYGKSRTTMKTKRKTTRKKTTMARTKATA